VYHKEEYVGIFKDWNKAVKSKAEAARVSTKSLKRAASSSGPASKSSFEGVVRDRKRWRAQSPAGEYLGNFATESEAVTAVSEHRGVPRKCLRKPPHVACDIDDQISRFRALMQVR
jgi:hypothetical protein